MKYFLSVILVTALFAAYLHQTTGVGMDLRPMGPKTSVDECISITEIQSRDNCLIKAAKYENNKDICYRVSNDIRKQQCMANLLDCDFPYFAHPQMKVCAISIDTLFFIFIQWSAMVAALTFVFKWADLRMWFRGALMGYMAAAAVLTLDPAIASGVFNLIPESVMRILDNNLVVEFTVKKTPAALTKTSFLLAVFTAPFVLAGGFVGKILNKGRKGE